MNNVDRCLICGEVIPEGAQVCRLCMERYGVDIGEETQEITEELRDIAGVLSITANTDGNIKQSMESILRIADRLERKKKDGKNSERTKVFAESSICKAKDGNNL